MLWLREELFRTGDERARRLLLEAVRDENPEVSRLAADAIAVYGPAPGGRNSTAAALLLEHSDRGPEKTVAVASDGDDVDLNALLETVWQLDNADDIANVLSFLLPLEPYEFAPFEPWVVEQLLHPVVKVRTEAVMCLANFKPDHPDIDPMLDAFFDYGSVEERETALSVVLKTERVEFLDRVLAMLHQDPVPGLRLRAALVAKTWDLPEVELALTAALQDPDCDVRVAAALGLARVGESAGADILAAIAGGQDSYCGGPESRDARRRALIYLSYLADSRCVPPALQLLCERPLGVSNLADVFAAINALREVDALAEARPMLLELLQDPSLFIRVHAAGALHEIGEPAGTDALIAFMTDPVDPNLRRQAIQRAGEFVDPVFQPAFESLTTHPDPYTAQKAVEALEKLQSGQGN